jgi:hypothetical protein
MFNSTHLVTNRYHYIPTAEEVRADAERIAKSTTWCGVRLGAVNTPHLMAAIVAAGGTAHAAMDARQLVDAFVTVHLAAADAASFVKCTACGGESDRELDECAFCKAARGERAA